MVQLTYYVAPWDRGKDAPELAEPLADDVHEIRHGYNLADVHLLAKRAVWRIWGLHLDYHARYDLAWSGIVHHLYAAEAERPTPGDLVFAGQDAIAHHVREELRHAGRAKDGDHDLRRRFTAYWETQIRHASSPEPRIVERVALWQIWPELTAAQRGALLALATHGTYRAAADSLGIAEKTFKQHVGNARHRFFDLWHEGEQASRIWGADRRVDRNGQRAETSYRKAAKAIRRGRTPRTTATKPAEEVEHGKVATYNNRRCRCAPCVEAKRLESQARRRGTGTAGRRQMTATQLQDAIRRNEEGESWSAIAASLGFSDGYLRSLRRGTAQPIPDAIATDALGEGLTSVEVADA
jgi:DNA-binding CsgD family transcriptional regulator